MLDFVRVVSPARWRHCRRETFSCNAMKTDLISLASGVKMEVRASEGGGDDAETIVFVHGSFHSAWCWDNFLNYFGENGYNAYALSLRGTSRTPSPTGKLPTLDDHVQDLKAAVDKLSPERPPTIVSHSIGSIFVMKYLEKGFPARLSAFLAPTPPSGNNDMTRRYFTKGKWIEAWRITRGLALRAVGEDPELVRTIFFSKEDDEKLITSSMDFFSKEKPILDLRDAFQQLPSKSLPIDSRVAPWSSRAPPVVVFGGTEDYIVDIEGVDETAEFFGTKPTMFDGLPHDMMLTKNWPLVADELLTRLKNAAEG